MRLFFTPLTHSRYIYLSIYIFCLANRKTRPRGGLSFFSFAKEKKSKRISLSFFFFAHNLGAFITSWVVSSFCGILAYMMFFYGGGACAGGLDSWFTKHVRELFVLQRKICCLKCTKRLGLFLLCKIIAHLNIYKTRFYTRRISGEKKKDRRGR